MLRFPRKARPDQGALMMTGLWGVSTWALFGRGTWFVLCGLMAMMNLWRFGRSLVQSRAAVNVGPDGMEVPLAFGRMARMAWTEIELVALHVGKVGQRLLLSTPGRTLVLESGRFESPTTPQLIFEAARARIAALPDGHERLYRMQEGMADTRRIAKRPAPATFGLLLVLTAIFVLQMVMGNHAATQITLGANVPVLVFEGEWWRLVSANFLHGFEAHLVINGFALWIIGTQLERLLGSQRLLGVYLLSAVAGAAASTFYTGATLSLGSSTAVFGVIGAMGVLHLRRADLPLGFRQPWRWWALILGANAALPLIIPVIDWMAHVGGFVAGAGSMWLLMAGRPLRPGTDARAKGLLLVTGLVTAVGLGFAAHSAATGDPIARALKVVGGSLPTDSESRNEMAWHVVVDPSADRKACLAAAELIRPAVEAKPGRPDLRDTLATALHRTGDWKQATMHQRRAFEDLADYPFPRTGREHQQFATQLARFYHAGKPPPRRSVLEVVDGGPKPLSAAPASGDHVLFALVTVGDKLKGLLRVRLTRSDRSGLAPHEFRRLPNDAELRVVDMLPAGKTTQPPNTWSWWPADPETLAYP